MTMLDGMRRHKSWLKWSLALVCLTFILFYVPSFMDGGGVPGITGPVPSDVVASVQGHEITAGEYQRQYALQLQSLRQAYGGSLDESMLRQLGVGQRIISQMVEEAAMVAQAERLGLRVTDAELAERIKRMPTFQQNGQFVGETTYRQILSMQRPPLRPTDFEAQLRRSLLAEKLQAAVTSWVRVSDEEVDAEYRRRNEKVKVDLAVLPATQFQAGIEPTEAELTEHYTSHQEAYQEPEKRRVRYLAVNTDALLEQVTVTPTEVQNRYRDSVQTYSTPEQVRASHILFTTEGKDEAQVRAAAEAVLARAKAGEDFAALARQYSEDEANKETGGDLDYFGRGVMAKEFEDAAFALAPGEISGLVQSPFGLHIIKTVDKRAASTRSLDEVRGMITEQIKQEKARQQAADLAADIADEIDEPSDLDAVASARGLTVGDSGLFARDEPLAGLGFAPTVAAEAFNMSQGDVSGQLSTNQGYAFIAVTEIQAPHVPPLDNVRDRVREDVVRRKALELAKARAATLAAAGARGSFAAAARAAGVEAKSTDFIARGAALPDVGVNGTVDEAIFKLQPGEVTEPIVTDNAVVVAKVVDRQDVTPESLQAERDAVRNDMLQQRRQSFFAAYMDKARQDLDIRYSDATIRSLLGS